MNKKYTSQQIQESFKFNKTVQVGDFILTQKDSLSYSFLRSVLGIEYDHLMVLISENELLHIGWPKIRIINSIQVIAQSSKYCILRPNFKEGEVQQFITLLKTSLDHSYDYQQLIKGLKQKLLNKVPEKPIPYEPNLQKKRVCTDLVFYALEASSQIFREVLPNFMGYLDYALIGSFTPDDAYTLAKVSQYFLVVQKTEIIKPQNTLKHLKSYIVEPGSLSISNLFLKNYQFRQLLSLITLPKDFQKQYQLLVFSLNLIQFYSYSRPQKIKKLVQMVLKNNPNYSSEAKRSKITKRIILFVDILDIIRNPISLSNYKKLLKLVLNIILLSKEPKQEMLIEFFCQKLKLLSWMSKSKL